MTTRSGRAGPRDDAHEEDGGGPDRLPARVGAEGPLPALEHRHDRAHRDRPRPPAGRVRRPRRASTCLREGLDLPEVSPRRDPRRRQGGLPPVEHLAHPDDGSSREERLGSCGLVCRRHHRLDAPRHGRDRAPPERPAAYNAEHGIDPQTIRKAVTDLVAQFRSAAGPATGEDGVAASVAGIGHLDRSRRAGGGRASASPPRWVRPARHRRRPSAERRRRRVDGDVLPADELERLIDLLETEMQSGRRPTCVSSTLPGFATRFARCEESFERSADGGTRPPRRPRSPRAQPEEHLARAAARQLIVFTGLSGLGEVLARLRHDLRRGPATLRRVALLLCPAVPRADGQAGRRLHRGSLAGHLDRPEVGLPQPPLHGRDGDGDLRLPAAPVRSHRPAALPELRTDRHPPEPAADRRPGHAAPVGTRFQSPRPVVRGRKGEYSTLLDDLAKQGYARVRVDGTSSTCRSGRRSSSPATSSTRSRWSSTGWCERTGSSGG